MRLLSFTRHSEGLVLLSDQGRLKLQVCADHIIRVVYTLEEALYQAESPMILSREVSPATCQVRETPETLAVCTRVLQLVIDRQTLAFTWLDARWFQLGAFLPMFRSQGTDTPARYGGSESRAAALTTPWCALPNCATCCCPTCTPWRPR